MLLLPLLTGILITTSPAQEPQEAKEAFDRRQADLVALAGHLGALHRFRQLCAEVWEDPDLFRNRMREIVPLEVPMGRTRLDMIAAFNSGFRDASRDHLVCSSETRNAYQGAAEAARAVTQRLARPFPK